MCVGGGEVLYTLDFHLSHMTACGKQMFLCHPSRSLFELLAEGRTLTELCENLQKLPDSQKVSVTCHI